MPMGQYNQYIETVCIVSQMHKAHLRIIRNNENKYFCNVCDFSIVNIFQCFCSVLDPTVINYLYNSLVLLSFYFIEQKVVLCS